MKKQLLLLLPLTLVVTLPLLATAADEDLHFNGFHFNGLGFLPEHVKRVSVVTEEDVDTLLVRRASDDEVVLEVSLDEPRVDPWVNVRVLNGDFTELDEPGVYYLEVPDLGVSRPFPISETVYDPLFENAMRGFYGMRSGVDIEVTHGGETFAHEAGHLEDGLLDYLGEEGEIKDGVGGWYDAGDYGKYVVNGAFTVGMMLAAWEDFSDVLKDTVLDMPESGGELPDFLVEVKWELDWLLKMQLEDGTVSHKLTARAFAGFVQPADHKDPRYFTPYSTAATAGFVAVMAKAARIYEPYDEEFAKTCLDAAERSFDYLADHPDNVQMSDNFEDGISPFRTGAYDTLDGDDRIWAAAEMFETTGNEDALALFELRAGASGDFISIDSFDWGNVRNLGTFVYLNSKREGRDEDVVSSLEEQILGKAEGILADRDASGFGRGLRSTYWGSNGTVLRMCMILAAADRIDANPAYADACVEQIDHMYGRNYYGRSQVTGDGFFPPCKPHDRRSGADDVRRPYPGLLVGGGSTPTNWVDTQGSYETNEVAINWNGALVYALAGFVSGGAEPEVEFEPEYDDCTEDAPPPPPEHIEESDSDTEDGDTDGSEKDSDTKDSDTTEAVSGGCSCTVTSVHSGTFDLILALLR